MCRSRPGCRLDLEPQLWLRSNLQPVLDLYLSHGSGSRSNPQPGLDLDLSHGCGLDLDLDLGVVESYSSRKRVNMWLLYMVNVQHSV